MDSIEHKKPFEIETDASTKKQYNKLLYITSRQVSWLAASIILLSFFVFIAGYFLGQRKALEQFTQSIEQDAFADHIYSNMCALYDTQSGSKLVPNEQVMQSENQEQKEPANQAKIKTVEQKIPEKRYYAQLIGLGTSRASHRFVERLQQKNMSVKVKERHSKTAQGKKIIWYQVITDTFSNKNDLLAFVEKIKKEERLKDIRLVTS